MLICIILLLMALYLVDNICLSDIWTTTASRDDSMDFQIALNKNFYFYFFSNFANAGDVITMPVMINYTFDLAACYITQSSLLFFPLLCDTLSNYHSNLYNMLHIQYIKDESSSAFGWNRRLCLLCGLCLNIRLT